MTTAAQVAPADAELIALFAELGPRIADAIGRIAIAFAELGELLAAARAAAPSASARPPRLPRPDAQRIDRGSIPRSCGHADRRIRSPPRAGRDARPSL